jgi:hypothetical protein
LSHPCTLTNSIEREREREGERSLHAKVEAALSLLALKDIQKHQFLFNDYPPTFHQHANGDSGELGNYLNLLALPLSIL